MNLLSSLSPLQNTMSENLITKDCVSKACVNLESYVKSMKQVTPENFVAILKLSNK